jgi:hypothetical protein
MELLAAAAAPALWQFEIVGAEDVAAAPRLQRASRGRPHRGAAFRARFDVEIIPFGSA